MASNGKGSNDLNMLLKAQVVKVRAELDVKGSMPKIRQQVDEISKKLESKPVKLKAKFDLSVKDLNAQLKTLTNKIHESKTVKSPIKLKVQIDVAGSATLIKKQLQDIYKTVADFNKKYGAQVEKMRQQTQKAQLSSKMSVPTNANVLGFDYKQYVSQVDQAKKYMKQQFGKGNFTSFEMKDAEGNLKGFTAQLEKANGVVQKIKYQWDADKKKFTPIGQETVNSIERNVHKASQSLKGLYADIEKLQKGSGRSNLFRDYNKLEGKAQQGKLTNDEVKALQQQIKEESVLQGQIKSQNDLLYARKKLLADIIKMSKQVNDVSKRADFKPLKTSAVNAKSADEIRNIRLEADKLTSRLKNQQKVQQEDIVILKQRLKMSRELKQLEGTIRTQGGSIAPKYVAETRAMIEQIKTTRQLEQATNRLNRIKDGKWSDNLSRSMTSTTAKVEEKLRRLVDIGGITQASFSRQMQQLSLNSKRSLGDLERQLDLVSAKLKRKQSEMARDANRTVTLLDGKSGDVGQKQMLGNIKSAIQGNDIASLQKYIGQIYKGQVETIKMTDTTDKLGRAVQRLDVKMAGTGKTVKTFSVDLDRANNKLRQTSQGVDYNANRNLGVFEQLKIAMARVPVWMGAMTAFYGTIRSVQAMSREIMEVDKAMTNLARVSDAHINIDTLFEGAVGLSKDLGNNMHDILETMGEFARTFGDFNERQLIAITETATLMSNVSELTTQEASESLVGTMNAFGIVADESIRIADVFNEVDNNYAVSTKQLAEGMSKTASTAKTFGVTMEESAGHITAISSVTMESGKVIGNSLKTIYSRITTMADAEGVLNDVGISINDMAGNVKPVQDILSELATKWYDLTDSERQNIAVKVAGRYQLSRFLALMNNWQTATDATATALTSEGSAMKENAKYMQSFEARVNKLKNAFTEFALSIGDAFLSDALTVGIELLIDMAKFAVDVVDKVGALPPVFLALFLVLNKMNVFSGLKNSIMGVITQIGIFKTAQQTAVRGGQGQIAGLTAGWNALTRAEATASAGAKAFGFSLKSALISTGIGAVIVVVGVLIEKLVSWASKQKKIKEETEKATKKLIDSYRNTEGGLDNLIDKHVELQKAVDNGSIKEGSEAYNEYLEVNQKIAKQMPTMVKYVDSKGVAHMKTADAMRKEYDIAQKLSKEEAKLANLDFTKKLAERAKKIGDFTKEISKLTEKQSKLEEENGKQKSTYMGYGETVTYKADNGKQIQQTKIEALLAYQEVQDQVQKLTGEIKNNVLASLEAQGQLKNLSDTQKGMVETLITSNEKYFTNITDKMAQTTDKGELNKLKTELQDRAQKLFEIGEEVGTMLSDKSQQLVADATEGMTNKLQISETTEQVKKDFDVLIKSLPTEFFSLDTLKNADDFKQKLNDVFDIANQVKGGATNFDNLKKSLTDMGIEGDTASRMVAQMAFQYDNASLKADVLKQAEDGLIDTTSGLIDVALEATDVMQNLFGYSSEDMSAIASHVETLQALQYMYGDNADKTEAWQESLDVLSLTLGLQEDEVLKQLPHLKQMGDFVQELKFKYNDAGEIIGIETENMSKAQLEYFNKVKDAAKDDAEMMDILTGKKTLLASGEIVATDATNANTEAKKANNDASKAQADALDTLAGKFATLKGDMNATNRSAYIDTIKSQLDEFDGKINITKDQAGNLKFVMADGSASPYLDGLTGQLEDLGMKIGIVEDDAGNLKIQLSDGTGSVTLTTIDQNAKDAKIALDETIGSIDKMNEKKLLPNDYSEINFSDLMKGIDDTTAKVDLLSDALQGTAENAEAINGIQGILSALKDVASDVAQYIKDSLSGATGDLDDLADKASSAKKKVDGLKSALEKLKGASKGISLSSFKTFEGNLKDARKAVDDLKKSFEKLPKSVRTSAGEIKNASGKIEDAVKNQERAVEKLAKEYKTSSGKIKSAFGDMAKAVQAKTSGMISKHDSQRSSINKLADSAKSARSAITKMVSSANNAMGDLDSYIAKANKARDAGNRVPKNPGGGGGFVGRLFNMFSAGATPQTAPSVASAMSTFSASAGEPSGSAGGGGEGTSGIIQPQTSYVGNLNMDAIYEIHALASKSKAPAKKELAELVKPNNNEREMTKLDGLMSRLEAKMQRMVKNTTSYRDALKQVIAYQNTNYKLTSKELSATTKRNAYIEKRLKQLKNTSKHTEKQREEYNKLQGEYDSNLSKINSLRTSMESITNDIKARSLEMFTDFIDQIANKYDGAISAIQKRTDDIEFKLDVLELTNPDDVEKQLKLMADKAKELKNEEKTTGNKRNTLKSEYDKAVKKYGKNSDQAKKALDEYEKASEAYEDAVIKTLQAEKQIKDVRGEVADKGIKQLKDYYNMKKDMAIKAIDIEKRELEKAHKAKMDMYDSEIEKVSSVYDEKLKKMDAEKSSAEYQEQLDEKNAKKAELVNKISILSRDTSLEGRKKVADLKKELSDAEKEISDFMKQRQDELLRQSIEQQKQDQLDALNKKKEDAQEDYDKKSEELDNQKEKATEYYDDKVNNEKYWAEMKDRFIKGDTSGLTKEMDFMNKDVGAMDKGFFDNLTKGFAGLSDEVKKEFAKMFNMDIDNLIFNNKPVNEQVKDASGVKYVAYTGSGTAYKNPDYTTAPPKPSTPKPAPSTPSKPKPKPAPAKRYHTVKDGDTLWDLAEKFYGNPYQWEKIARANENPDPRKLQIGRKLLIPFRTGGYTGDWQGDDGKLAVLHKKELVLNDKQTKDILNTTKILDKIKNVIPSINKPNITKNIDSLAGTSIENNFELTINIDKLNGDVEDANFVSKTILKGLKKLGKK
jgi:TP901 family phage tail tape measure protein